MENKIENSISGRKSKIIPAAGLIFVSLFAIYYFIVSASSPAKKVSSINSEYGYKKPEKNALNDSIFNDSAFVALYRQKAFLQARLAMAATDSVALAINLPDSIATLSINGVSIYRTKISRSKISRVFSRAGEYAVTTMLSKPFTILKDYSSIEKEPVVHKVAPKDTTEYKPDAHPDTSKVEFVNFILETTDGFRLYVYQESRSDFPAAFSTFLFDLTDRLRNSAGVVKSMVLFRKPEYHPFIKIRLPAKDARIIYRALPHNGQFAIFR